LNFIPHRGEFIGGAIHGRASASKSRRSAVHLQQQKLKNLRNVPEGKHFAILPRTISKARHVQLRSEQPSHSMLRNRRQGSAADDTAQGEI
jgi:hypothetical protein